MQFLMYSFSNILRTSRWRGLSTISIFLSHLIIPSSSTRDPDFLLCFPLSFHRNSSSLDHLRFIQHPPLALHLDFVRQRCCLHCLLWWKSQEVPDELSWKKANRHSYPHLDRIWHFSCLVQGDQTHFSGWWGGRDDQASRFICYLCQSQAGPVYSPRCSMLESGESSLSVYHIDAHLLVSKFQKGLEASRPHQRATFRGVHSTWMTLPTLFISPRPLPRWSQRHPPGRLHPSRGHRVHCISAPRVV